jgi:predicted amidohydrolase
MPNLHLIRQVVEKHVAAEPADLLVLPEVFNGVHCGDDPAAGPLARQFLSTLARACRLNVIGGSIDYQHKDVCRRNTCFVVDREGREVGRYHKRVLFGPEQADRTAGDEAGVFEIDGLRVAVMICADLWNPLLPRELVDGADLLCVATKTTVPSGAHIDYARRLWWNLALTRAMENGLPLVVSDWAEGRHETIGVAEGTRTRSIHYTSGGASITDPGKRPQFDALQVVLPRGEPGILAATFDLDAAAQFREYRRGVGLLPMRSKHAATPEQAPNAPLDGAPPFRDHPVSDGP